MIVLRVVCALMCSVSATVALDTGNGISRAELFRSWRAQLESARHAILEGEYDQAI